MTMLYRPVDSAFPFLLGRAFIEAPFLKGPEGTPVFPFLLGGTFIEASWLMSGLPLAVVPFLRFLAETFIEAARMWRE